MYQLSRRIKVDTSCDLALMKIRFWVLGRISSTLVSVPIALRDNNATWLLPVRTRTLRKDWRVEVTANVDGQADFGWWSIVQVIMGVDKIARISRPIVKSFTGI